MVLAGTRESVEVLCQNQSSFLFFHKRFQEGAKVTTLAEEYGLRLATLYWILKEGNKKKKKKGPQMIITGWARHKLLQKFCESPTISAAKAVVTVGISASDCTVRCELWKAAFTYIRMRKVQVLTQRHKEACLKTCHLVTTTMGSCHFYWWKEMEPQQKWWICLNLERR